MFCEAGLRARFVVKRRDGAAPIPRLGSRPLKAPPADADTEDVFRKKRTSTNSVVGLELDPGHLAAAEVHVNGAISLTRGVVAPLRPGIMRDGEVSDPAALTEALKALFAENELPKRVRLGIANQRIVVRTLDLPPLDDPAAIAAAVQAQAPDHIPMPMNEAIVDHQPLGLVSSPSGGEKLRVVVVAVRREMIERITGSCRAAGLEIEGIDLSAFGMVRALARPDETAAVLYLNVAGLVNVAVANPTGCLFTRAAAGGLDTMVQTLVERRALTVEHARQWMQHVGLLAPLEDIDGDAEVIAAVRAVLDEGVHQLADTVRNSLNFYRTQESSEPVERGVLTGPAVDVPGLAEKLSELLRLPIEPAVVGTRNDEVSDLGRLTVAAGLAVGEVA
jgi:type IV pilus assembly protein PilM